MTYPALDWSLYMARNQRANDAYGRRVRREALEARPDGRCSVTQVGDRDWRCGTHGRDAEVCERAADQGDDTDPALAPFEPGGGA